MQDIWSLGRFVRSCRAGRAEAKEVLLSQAGKLFRTAAGICLAVLALASPARADRLEDIRERGKLIVGVQQDFRPWAFRNEKGELAGLEIDLAKDLAKRLGVELQLVPIDSPFKRMQAAYTGEVDLTIGGMGDNPKRRESVGFVTPHYYASGYDVLARETAGLKAWADLKGRKVCVVEGSWYARRLSDSFGAELVADKDYPAALEALQGGRCEALAYDNTWNAVTRAADEKRWKGFAQPLPTQATAPWGIVLAKREVDSPWGQFLAEVSLDWHKSGSLIALEKKWSIKPEPWLEQQAKKLKVG